jgi:hypothetical protein
MLKIFFFSFFFFASTLMAKEMNIEVMIPADKVSEQTSQELLLSLNGYAQLLTTEMLEQHLDSTLFWAKLEKKKMGPQEEESFLKKYFEKTELSLLALEDSSLKSAKDGLIHGRFAVSFDPQKIKNLYDEVMLDLEELRQKTFYLLPEIEIDRGLKWEDVGVSKAEQFTEAISESWKKMAMAQFPGFSRYEILEKDFAVKPEAMNPQSVTLRWKSLLKGTLKNSDTQSFEYELSAQYVLVTSKTNNALISFDFPLQRREFSRANKKQLSSQLASLVYNLLNSQASKISSQLATQTSLSISEESLYLLKGAGGLSEVYQVINLLQDSYKDLKLSASMKNFSSPNCELLIRSALSKEQLIENLSKNEGKLNLGEQKLLIFNPADKTFAILPKQKNN